MKIPKQEQEAPDKNFTGHVRNFILDMVKLKQKKLHYVKTSRTTEELEKNLSDRVHLSDLELTEDLKNNEKNMLRDLINEGNFIPICIFNEEGHITSLSMGIYGKIHEHIHFPYLRNLSISYKVSEHINFVCKHKSSLKVLKLIKEDLEEIPKLSDFIHLEELDLSRNKIENVNWFGDLPHLWYLNVSKNQITSLKGFNELIGCLNIEEIDLSGNYISELYGFEPLRHFPNLKTINLKCNKIKNLNIIHDIPKLKRLELANNQIEQITAIKNLSNVKIIDLSNWSKSSTDCHNQNEITKIENLYNLPNLSEIQVKGNPIIYFSGIENLPNLETICCIQKEFLPKNFIQDWKLYFKNLGFKFYWPQDGSNSLLIMKPEITPLKFKINEFLSLKLDSDTGETIIRVDGKNFMICKSLLLQIPTDNIYTFNEIQSIDELEDIIEFYDQDYEISPETEFRGHCSNLQAWYENDYDTRILVKHIAFPLLKKLTEAGDSLAKKVFKEEIASRYASGFPTVVEYLKNEGYLNYLTENELKSLNIE
ncbi:MAG: hypothetical protein EU529_12090 [Promethearchaeota archaeon]|nr:MAG: hypothetical protein EU529_12090 [Candidatus Lokiarchaeota archaeon]